MVLSEDTLSNLDSNDLVSAAAIRAHIAYWDDVAVEKCGVRTVSTGHGFSGIGRQRLLLLLQARARELGVKLHFQDEVADIGALMGEFDLVVAADGLNSRVRDAFAPVFQPDIELYSNKFVWLGTHQTFKDAFTFIFEPTEHGWMWAHAYQFEPGTATFIVECSAATWGRAGFGDMSQEESIALCERIFAAHLGGHGLLSNANHIRGSAWISFPKVLCGRWRHENLVLSGRRGGQRPLLHRLGHQAGAGERGGPGARGAAGAARCRPCWSATRKRARPRPCACNRRRGTQPRGSRRWSVTCPLDPVQFKLFPPDPLPAHQP